MSDDRIRMEGNSPGRGFVASWVRTKSQERIYQSKQSGTLALIVYVLSQVCRRIESLKNPPKDTVTSPGHGFKG